MATLDLRSLYELYRKLDDGKMGLPQPNGGEASGVSANSVPAGGVLAPLHIPQAAAPATRQSTMPSVAGFRPPLPSAGLGIGRRFPLAGGSSPAADIPDPHLERLVPGWMRDLWAAGTLVPRMAASGTQGGNGMSQDLNASPSQQGSMKIEDRSGGLGWYVGTPDPNIRILKRVDDEAAEEKEVQSPPLAPENPDDTADDEGCDEEWADARAKCEEGFRGPPGQSPYSRPKGRRGRLHTIETCMAGVVSERCGGNPTKPGSSGAERAKRNNEAIQKKRDR